MAKITKNSPAKLDLQGKSVTLMGLGLYSKGSGISAAKFCIERGAKLLITDLKTKKQLQKPVEDLQSFYLKLKGKGKKVFKPKYVLGKHNKKDFKNADLIIRNPGVRIFSPYIKIARKNNIPIENDISLFLKEYEGTFIGITGTRGKSTTTRLIYEILKLAEKKVIIGGNIGESPLSKIKFATKDSFAVLELSSWMLESLEPHGLSPHIGVFTNLLSDHLDAYDSSEDYGRAKQAIFNNQKREDHLILNLDNNYTKKMGSIAKSQIYWASVEDKKIKSGCYLDKSGEIFFIQDGKKQKIFSKDKIKLLGKHNISNVLFAINVAKILKIPNPKILKAVGDFKGVANRLEYLGEYKSVKFYNDTTASTPDAAIVALDVFPAKKIVLIAGGSEKNLDFKELAKKIVKKVKYLILFKDKASFRLFKEIEKVNSEKLQIDFASSMKEAMTFALKQSEKDDIILLSPGCASFGIFINEFERGSQFVKSFNKLKEK